MWCIFSFIFLILILVKAFYYFATVKTYGGAECLVGKVAIITGGNRGIGLEVTKCLAARGCKVIIACRSNAESIRKSLIKMTHNKNIFVKHLDLQSFESVRNFSKEIHKEEEKVDILINNAGIGLEFGLTPDGFNPVVQTNVYSPFLLTHLLADLLKQSDDGRIVFTSSALAFINNLTLENLNAAESTAQQTTIENLRTYGNTKLCHVIMSQIFADKLKMYDIKSNVIHPGFINTEIWNALELDPQPLLYRLTKGLFYVIIQVFANTSFAGAQGIVTLALSNRYKNVTGEFFYAFRMWSSTPNPFKLKNKIFCKEIWKAMETMVKLEPHEKL